jgi:predicted permease
VETLLQDIRFAGRLLKKSPRFAATAALTIALGIGATTTIFSTVNAVLLRPPPGIHDANELVRIHRIDEDGSSYNSLSYPNFEEYRGADIGLSDLAGMALTGVTIGGGSGDAELTFGLLVTHNFFDLLGVRPAAGRLFLPEDDVSGKANLVVVLSHAAWNRRFGGDSSIVGRTVRIQRHAFTVVGVTEEGFRGPNSVLEVGVWLPMGVATLMKDDFDTASRSQTWVELLGRRTPGVGAEQVEVAANRISANLRTAFPDENPEYGIDVTRYAPISTEAFGAAAAVSLFLFLISGMVLIIASVNVGSMLLSRASQRRREMALRLALGAPRMRIVRQLLTESILLFTLGGMGGLLITIYATRLLGSYQLPIDLPVVFDFTPDMRALVFSVAVAFVTGIVFGLAPALLATRTDLNTALSSSRGTATRSRMRNAFVVAQVAGSAALLVVAGLFARGLSRFNAADLGFEPDNVHAISFELDFVSNYSDEEAARFYAELMERISQLPQVASLGMIDFPPVTLGGQSTPFSVPGREPLAGEEPATTDYAHVTPGLLETFRISMVRGRDINERDRVGTSRIAVVNETFAMRAWPGESPLGKRVRLGEDGADEVEVVGVARNAKYRTVTEDPRNMVYLPYAQSPLTNMVLVARITGDGTGMANTLRQIVRDLDADLPIDANVPYENFMGLALVPSKAAAILTTIFGTVGLSLAALGLYGVLAYAVSQRRHEFGIRIALGAGIRHLRTSVVRDAVKLVGIGLALGFASAIALSLQLRAFLYGVPPADPVTLACVTAILVAVAIAASYLPARRATRTDPMEALRVE